MCSNAQLNSCTEASTSRRTVTSIHRNRIQRLFEGRTEAPSVDTWAENSSHCSTAGDDDTGERGGRFLSSRPAEAAHTRRQSRRLKQPADTFTLRRASDCRGTPIAVRRLERLPVEGSSMRGRRERGGLRGHANDLREYMCVYIGRCWAQREGSTRGRSSLADRNRETVGRLLRSRGIAEDSPVFMKAAGRCRNACPEFSVSNLC